MNATLSRGHMLKVLAQQEAMTRRLSRAARAYLGTSSLTAGGERLEDRLAAMLERVDIDIATAVRSELAGQLRDALAGVRQIVQTEGQGGRAPAENLPGTLRRLRAVTQTALSKAGSGETAQTLIAMRGDITALETALDRSGLGRQMNFAGACRL